MAIIGIESKKMYSFTRVPGYYDSAIDNARCDDDSVDWCALIARQCGWLPLQKKEEMTVSVGNKQYTIKRTK